MGNLDAVILHKHVLFRDLIALELRELGAVEVVATTNDPVLAVELVRSHAARALVIESTEGFIDRHELLRLFCAGAQVVPQFIVISANLTTSEIEVLRDSVAHGAHLAGVRPLLEGALG